ncbi:MAG: hypothetical protein ACFNOL_03340, partial [Treponema maltophilum]
AYTEFTIGWRMGAGEDYKSKFWDWYESLTPAQQKEYRIHEGENFKFDKNGKHYVKAEGKFKMALLLVRD